MSIMSVSRFTSSFMKISFSAMTQKIMVWVFLSIVILIYVLAGQLGMWAHTDPTEMDTVAYLRAALQIKNTGGILSHIPNCFAGIYREATQHPLYLLLLSPWAEKNIRFFLQAKWISFYIGLSFLLSLFYIVKRLWGLREAFVSVSLVIFNATFLHMTTMVACESLMTLFFIASVFFIIKGFEDSHQWFIAGACVSLAFLTKSLAILLIPVFVISVIVYYRKNLKKVFRQKAFWGFFLIFFVISSPLLMRNIKLFKTPFYSDSSAVLWLDRWHDYYALDIESNPPNLRRYLKTHTLSGIAATLWKGIYFRDVRMLVDGLKPFAFWDRPLRLVTLQGYYERTIPWQETWALAMGLFFLMGCWKIRKRPELLVMALTLLIFLIFIGWYSKVFPGIPPTRLIYPILFLIIMIVSKGFLAFIDLLRKNEAEEILKIRQIFLGTILFLVLFLAGLCFNYDWKKIDLKKSYNFSPIFFLQTQWAEKNLKPEEKILTSEIFSNAVFYLNSPLERQVVMWPTIKSLLDLRAFAAKNNIQYAFLDLATVAYNLSAFKDYYLVGPTIGLEAKAVLPEFMKKLEAASIFPRLYEVIEFDRGRL